MRLNFTKIGNLLCPTVGNEQGELIEDVQKCTVSSGGENAETVMTLTVIVKNGGPAVELVVETTKTTWQCSEADGCAAFDDRCVHAGSRPRLCAQDRGKTVTWREKRA